MVTTYGDVTISGCRNKEEINGNVAGDITALVNELFGGIQILSCENLENINSERYAAEIISETNLITSEDKPLLIEIINSQNNGTIKYPDYTLIQYSVIIA